MPHYNIDDKVLLKRTKQSPYHNKVQSTINLKSNRVIWRRVHQPHPNRIILHRFHRYMCLQLPTSST